MKRPIRIHLAAGAEMLDALEYLRSESPGLPKRLGACVRLAVRAVVENPDRYPVLVAPYHRYRVDPFKYAIVYKRCADGVIEITAFYHLMRDPKRLIERLRNG
jgi:hypothetical protein